MNSLKEEAKLLIEAWEEYGFPDICIEKFVFDNLFSLDTKDYNLKELFNHKAIQVVLDNGAQIINSYLNAQKLISLDSSEVIPSKEQYEVLFDAWSKAGWITYSEKNGQIKVTIKK